MSDKVNNEVNNNNNQGTDFEPIYDKIISSVENIIPKILVGFRFLVDLYNLRVRDNLRQNIKLSKMIFSIAIIGILFLLVTC